MIRNALKSAALASIAIASIAGTASAQDCILGEIKLFALNFDVRDYASADGRLLPISQNSTLFALLGTNYGGDGVTTFALPDLRGRVFIGDGQGPGLPNARLGDLAGTHQHTLTQAEMPGHTHVVTASGQVRATTTGGNTPVPTGGNLANDGADRIYKQVAADTLLASDSVKVDAVAAPAGGSLPHNNMQPYLVLNPQICVEGIFPSRN